MAHERPQESATIDSHIMNPVGAIKITQNMYRIWDPANEGTYKGGLGVHG